jgi:uncharacterized phiE125 gp8 family phage protein
LEFANKIRTGAMTLICTVPPEELPVWLNEAKAHLRICDSADDALITSYIETVVSTLDGADGQLGRCLLKQSWALAIDFGFPRVIKVPLPPLISVDSITYVDANGVQQTVDPSVYQVTGVSGADKAKILPAVGRNWPTPRHCPEAVMVRFTAGYGEHHEDVPPAIRGAILEMVAQRYAFREAAIAGTIITAIPASAQEALSNYRVWSF